MSTPAVVVAGTHSGVGKTTVAVGLMAALRERGMRVAAFKIGPDFLDPQLHAAAAGCPSSNLDGWMLPRAANLAIAGRRGAHADIAVVEGVMGLFDGHDGRGEAGSTAELAKWLGAPVLLVLDAWALSRSAAAVVAGFAGFDPELDLAGVVLNRVAGERHERWLREAIEPTGVPVVGVLPPDDALAIGERHLGLAVDAARPAHALAAWARAGIDLDAVTALARRARWPAAPETAPAPPPVARIAVLRDEALSFHYPDSLAELERAGADLVEVSPLRDPLPPDADAVIAGGGYPELHGAALAANVPLLGALRAHAAAGRPIYAECGGLMLLGESLVDAGGERHAMAGILPTSTRMTQRPTLAYAEVEVRDAGGLLPAGERIRGHVFHFAAFEREPGLPAAYVLRAEDLPPWRDGWRRGGVLASWVHLHFGARPDFAQALTAAAGASRARSSY